MAHRVGQKPVGSRHLVRCRGRERLVDLLDARAELALEAGNHQIEIIVGADREHAHRAALGRLRVDVVELLEVRWIFQVTEQRQPMPPVACRRLRGCRPHQAAEAELGQRRGGEREGGAVKEKTAREKQGIPPQSNRSQVLFSRVQPDAGYVFNALCRIWDTSRAGARLSPAPSVNFSCERRTRSGNFSELGACGTSPRVRFRPAFSRRQSAATSTPGCLW